MKLNLKILNLNHSVDVARDWYLQAEQAEVNTVMSEPYKIACVPAMFTQPNNFAYQFKWCSLDLSKFDLVIISDIEQERSSNLTQWINEQGIQKYVLAQGACHNSEETNSAITVVRSWWMQNLMRMNTFENTQLADKPYLFDALLGARRPHRDFVMLSMQKHSLLLEKSIVNYRDIFYSGTVIDNQTQQLHDYFPEVKLSWPYVSPNLDPAWEVKSTMEKSISPYVPWDIYRRTWYSIICETGFTGNTFFLTEKTTKALFSQRVFVLFAPCQFLKTLRTLGFQTFGSVIDEDYDEEFCDIVRYQKAWAQVLSLSQQDPTQVYKKLQPILQHNYHRLWTLQQEIGQQQQDLLRQNIPVKYIID
jgi:hypothetical protein